MKTLKGPALFLGQFAGDTAPFDSWDAITKWAAGIGYVGVQVPTWAGQLIDLKQAAASQDYCDEFKGVAKFVAPLLAPALKKLGDEAEAGMRDALGRLGRGD